MKKVIVDLVLSVLIIVLSVIEIVLVLKKQYDLALVICNITLLLTHLEFVIYKKSVRE